MRSQRRDDVRAERCLRVGRDQAALRDVLGVHVVYFTWFLPNRETSRPRLEMTIWGIELANASSLRDPRVPETLLQSWGITPNSSARTSLRPTLSQLSPRARVRGFCVPYLHKTCQHHAPAMEVGLCT